MRSAINTITIAALLALIAGCIPDGQPKRYFDVKPAQLADGWETSTPGEAGLDSGKVMEAYDRFWDEDAYFNARSLLVVRHGKLVFENYCQDISWRDTVQHIQSVTKSVTSLVFGICRDDGLIPDLDALLYTILPDVFPDDSLKKLITLRHLLTMKSGISFDNDVYSDEVLREKPDNIARYILDKGMYAAPGKEFYYRDCDPQLVSCAVQKLTGKTVDEIARARLFEPLGIDGTVWNHNRDGSAQGGHGLFLTPRQMAKLGQLMLQKGSWQGQQLVSEDWVAQSTSAQTEKLPDIGVDEVNYGFYWWVLPGLESYTAWGHGGQFIYVVPELDMVIVMTSMPSTDDDVVGTRLPEFLTLAELITDAITD